MKMQSIFKKHTVTAMLATALLATSFSTNARPVNVGKGMPAGVDACSLGVVTGLKANGDGFLAVRTAPTTKAKMQYKIHNGQQVWMCDQNKSGSWIGVVYTKKGTDCRIDRRGPYKGRCYQGWVSARYIKVIAG